jgi:hypothetical protein
MLLLLSKIFLLLHPEGGVSEGESLFPGVIEQDKEKGGKGNSKAVSTEVLVNL